MTRPRPLVAVLWTFCAILLLAGAWTALRVDPAGAAEPAATVVAVAAAHQAGPTIYVPRGSLGTPLLPRLQSFFGLVVLLVLTWSLSLNRSRIPWRVVIYGTGLQLVFAVIILKTAVGAQFFDSVNTVVVALLGYTTDGARFVFGNLVSNNVPLGSGEPGNGTFVTAPGQVANAGAFFAFTVLPTIIFISSLMTVLYHVGVMQKVVRGMAWVMQKTMKTSGAETLSCAANIFVGQTEAPLLIKPFVERMTMSELMAVMTGGFATVAGGVMAAYVGMLMVHFPDIAGHLMAASVMSAPAALVCAKLMLPETEKAETANTLEVAVDRPDVNVIDAAARGASEGLGLALNVGAMLIAFVALIYLLNGTLGWVTGLMGFEGITLEWVFGWVMSPIAWLMGVSWHDAPVVGGILGLRTVLNEFFGYLQLASLMETGGALEPRSVVIITYAMCGFANFSSIAIQLGGIGGMAPSRRHDLSRIGLRAMTAGTIASYMTATVAGMIM
jgi:concentrative nucleoside transporter, CNT family